MWHTASSRPLTGTPKSPASIKTRMDDFQDAAKRHLDDAELLFAHSSQRLANASHLFGISAECSLKAIARHLDPHLKFTGGKKKGHIPSLFSELCNVGSCVSGNAGLAGQINGLNPCFANWTVSQRYEAQSTFALAIVLQEQKGATDAYLLMNNCLLGLI